MSKQQVKDIAEAVAAALTEACEKVDFDLRCIDWFSFNPDFYIKQQEIKDKV